MFHGDVFAFSLSEMYTQPSYWAMFGGSFFGDWTPKKYIVVNSVCGLTPSDWSNAGYAGTKVQYGRFIFLLLRYRNIYRNRQMQELRSWRRTGVICNLHLLTRLTIPGMNNIKNIRL